MNGEAGPAARFDDQLNSARLTPAPAVAIGLELLRDVPCTDESCPTALGGPTDPDLCADCAAAFERQGIATSNEQLTVDDEEAA